MAGTNSGRNRPIAGRTKTVTIAQLLNRYNMGGRNWIRKFVFGFPLVGTLSQKGVFPKGGELGTEPMQPQHIWEKSQARFLERSARSGFKNAQRLWEEAQLQVGAGWLDDPISIPSSGLLPDIHPDGGVNIASRIGVERAGKLRPCDDLNHNWVNIACSVWTPITLPPWDHIAQSALYLRKHKRNCEFPKADHAPAYNNLPLLPEHAHIAFVALRSPANGQWYAFPHRALIFGAVSEVLHYNCFSRILTFPTNRIFGIPLVGYFDDYGAMLPDSLSKPGLSTFSSFCTKLAILLKMDKSLVDKALTSLGLFGEFPDNNDNILRISLPTDKATRWGKIVASHIASGQILHSELDKLIGLLSCSQNAIFGRFGRTILRPLYNKFTNKYYYSDKLGRRELEALRWWETAIGQMRPRIDCPEPQFPDLVIYTDAAAKTRIISALILNREEFRTAAKADVAIASPTALNGKTSLYNIVYIYTALNY